jgi:hypothetical protein
LPAEKHHIKKEITVQRKEESGGFFTGRARLTFMTTAKLIATYKNAKKDEIELYKSDIYIVKINRTTGKKTLTSGYRGKELYDLINETILNDRPVFSLKYYAPFPLKYTEGSKLEYKGMSAELKYDKDRHAWYGVIDGIADHVEFVTRNLEDVPDIFAKTVDAYQKDWR